MTARSVRNTTGEEASEVEAVASLPHTNKLRTNEMPLITAC